MKETATSPSPLYTALLQALGVTANSVVATAWGRDYTLSELEAMTTTERRLTNWKLRSYNVYLRMELVVCRTREWFWRNVSELVAGFPRF